jgi:hypothetical protein
MQTSSRKEKVQTRSRVVIGLDTSFATREMITMAARLARAIHAPLRGIYIRDENLLRLAELPFACEVAFSGTIRSLDPSLMSRSLKAQAEAARTQLARIASQAHVEWSFEEERGRLFTRLAQSAGAEDTLVLRQPAHASRELARAVRAATHESRADVLLLSRGHEGVFSPRPLMPIVAAIDPGTSSGEAAYLFASDLARRTHMICRRISARGWGVNEVAGRAREIGASLVILNASWFSTDDEAAQLSHLSGCPVLLLGAERSALSDTPPRGEEER